MLTAFQAEGLSAPSSHALFCVAECQSSAQLTTGLRNEKHNF